MNFSEYESVKGYGYHDYCTYLQNKYGLSPCNYTFGGGGKDKRSIDGLELHHIKEHEVTGLSNKEKASNYPIEYQQPQNLCYCDYLEHMLLHIMIFEEDLEKNSDVDIMGILGVINHMVERLNDFYCKDLIGYRDYELNAYHKVKDDVDVYLKIIERIFNSTPKKLYSGICDHLCVSKNNSEDCQELRSNLYNDIKELSSVVQEHNKEFAVKIDEAITKNNRCLFVLGTSLGKTTTGLDYIIKHGIRGLVVHHQNNIRDVWSKNNDLVDTVSIQTLCRDYFSYDFSKYGLIIFDEAHHLSAPEWGKPIKFCIDNNIPVLGLTATPKKKVEELFGKDNVVYGYDVFEGIEKGILHPVSYVGALYTLPDKIKHAKEHPEELTPILKGKLDIALNNTPTVAEILYRNMPSDNRKGIIFAQDISDMDDAIDIVKNVFPYYDYKVISSHETEEHNRSVKEWFEETDCGFLCSVDMVSEGSHFNGVNTLIMLRKTKSRIKFEQQLGRVMVQTKYPDPNCIVFDLVNNALTTELFTEKLRKAVEGRGDVAVIHPGDDVVKDLNKKYIIVEDYTKPLVELIRLPRIDYDYWTEEENTICYEVYPKHGPYGVQKYLPHRTISSIQSHCRKYLKIHYQFSAILRISTIDGSIKKYDKVADARKDGYSSGIFQCLQRKMRTCNDFYWCYEEDYDEFWTPPEASFERGKSKKRPVYCFETNTVYENAIDASEQTGSNLSKIIRCCDKKENGTNGMHFCWYDEKDTFVINNTTKKGEKYSQEEIQRIFEYYPIIGMSSEFIAMFPNRTKASLAQMTSRLGVKYCGDKKTKIRVICVELNKVFNSVNEAAQYIGFKDASPISKSLKSGKTSGGYHWKYVEDDDDSIV